MALIDRDRARRAFSAYVAPYDIKNPRIALKVGHTYRVAAAGERIARSLGLAGDELDLAWLCCLLHDIGRFEQLRRWDTFSDARSASHPAIGVEVLFGDYGAGVGNAAAGEGSGTGSTPALRINAPELAHPVPVSHPAQADEPGSGRIESFLDDRAQDDLIRTAVGLHSDFRLPDSLDERARCFCQIVRDADKVDIFRTSGFENTTQTVLGVSEDEFLASYVSEPARRAFLEHRCLARNERETPLDMHVGTIALAFELVYPESLCIAREQGYLLRGLERPFGITRPFALETTRRTWTELTAEMRRWLASH